MNLKQLRLSGCTAGLTALMAGAFLAGSAAPALSEGLDDVKSRGEFTFGLETQ